MPEDGSHILFPICSLLIYCVLIERRRFFAAESLSSARRAYKEGIDMATKSAQRAKKKTVTRTTGPFQSSSQLDHSSWVTADSKFAGVILGDSATMLKQLPDEVFNVAVTSPPYYWVRDYGYDGQVGHEESVDAYIDALMKVFDEVKRTLHPEGVFFLNIGDTYYSGNGQPHGSDPRSSSRNFARTKLRPVDRSGWDIPKKSMIGVPWKVAFAMQQRGWTLRSDIIWNRVNAFVEPTARDRPYRQYEHVFMFSKSRFYSFDRTKLVEEDVWNIPIERNLRTRQAGHNAAFPSELARRCIEVGSPIGGHVLDPFVGSGTTVFTALAHDRNVVGVEMGEDYVDYIETTLQSDGHKPTTWKEVQKCLLKPSALWDTWAGNKNNFRKPGQGRPIDP